MAVFELIVKVTQLAHGLIMTKKELLELPTATEILDDICMLEDLVEYDTETMRQIIAKIRETYGDKSH